MNFAQELILATLEEPMTLARLEELLPEVQDLAGALGALEEAGMVKQQVERGLFGVMPATWRRLTELPRGCGTVAGLERRIHSRWCTRCARREAGR
jgi:hypothetical protein